MNTRGSHSVLSLTADEHELFTVKGVDFGQVSWLRWWMSTV